jgi:hypothetical protein
MAKQKLELTPDEEFLQNALRNGRAKKQDISMKAIGTPDVNLQARVKHLDIDHCRRLEKQLNESTDNLSPIILFFDEKKDRYYLADGHHRHHVYNGLKRVFIPAYVITSDRAQIEALEFATMCNREMCLGRTMEDKKKAVRMLLETELWWKRSDRWIGKHVGVGPQLCAQIRSTLSKEKNIKIPEEVENLSGIKTKKRTHHRNIDKKTEDILIQKRDYGFEARINGKKIYRKTKEQVIDYIKIAKNNQEEFKSGFSSSTIYRKLHILGFKSVFGNKRGRNFRLSSLKLMNIILCDCNFEDRNNLYNCISSLIASKIETGNKESRLIILCYILDSNMQKDEIDIFKKGGFEFMTPEELIESLNPNQRTPSNGTQPRRNPQNP